MAKNKLPNILIAHKRDEKDNKKNLMLAKETLESLYSNKQITKHFKDTHHKLFYNVTQTNTLTLLIITHHKSVIIHFYA